MTPASVVVQRKDGHEEPIYFLFNSEEERAAFLTCLHPAYKSIQPNNKQKTIRAREAIAELYKREEAKQK